MTLLVGGNYLEKEAPGVVKIWHDDIRRPPDETWTWARTNVAAQAVLMARGVAEISLDHDLGLHGEDPDAPAAELGRGTAEQTGYDLVKWMCHHRLLPAKITIHSWNPPGAERMAAALREAGCSPVVAPYVTRTGNWRDDL